MTTLTLHEAILYVIVAVLLTSGYLLHKHHSLKRTKLKTLKRKKKENEIKGSGNIQNCQHVTYNSYGPPEHMSLREQSLTETINLLFMQLREKDAQLKAKQELNMRLMDKIEAKEAMMDGLLNEIGTLKDEQRRFPVLQLRKEQPESRKEEAA
jgi:hypothetical protein